MIWERNLYSRMILLIRSLFVFFLFSLFGTSVSFSATEKELRIRAKNLATSICGYETTSISVRKKDTFVGRAGEIGRCQIRPETAKTLAKWEELPLPDLRRKEDSLKFAEIYVSYAVRYIKKNCRKLTERAVFHAYNNGLGAINCNPPKGGYADRVVKWILFQNQRGPWVRLLERRKHEYEQRFVRRRRRSGWSREDGDGRSYYGVSDERVGA